MSINNGFSKGILDIIREKNIKPKPKWRFLLKNYVIWGIGVVALVVGALAFSVVIYLLRHNDWNVYGEITDSLPKFILLTLPYFWLLLLVLFTVTVYYNIKHTRKGYRYPLPATIIVSVTSSILLGVLFFGVGFGQAIDDVLGERAPFYSEIFNRRPHIWNQPDRGRLAGLVVSQVSDTEFILLDPGQKEWLISGGSEQITVGRPVNLIGEQTGENEFRADRIMPVGPGKRFFMRCRNGHCPGLRPDGMIRIYQHLRDDPEFPKRPDIPHVPEKYPEPEESFGRSMPGNQDPTGE